MNVSNNNGKKQYVIIAGAGISMDPPSNLPSWWQYNKIIINIIKEQACELCPEASELINAIDVENALPVQCISDLVVRQGAGKSYFPLLELLNATRPNANHFALAELAERGMIKAIVTTNFDTLIENAFLQEAVPVYTIVRDEEYYELSRALSCKLFKIHGSVTDYDSLIDTVTQKAVGLSLASRLVLSNIFLDSEIIVIGFSGADLDFDMDYIPVSQALEEGNRVTWVFHPGSRPSDNVMELGKKYPDNFRCCEKNLSEVFSSLGIKYDEINNKLLKNDASNTYNPEQCDIQMNQKVRELFTSPHIGRHGCVGYCISLLNMMGLDTNASRVAEIYEKHINLESMDIFNVVGLRTLAMQKMHNMEFEKSIQYNLAVIKCLLRIDELSQDVFEEQANADDIRKEQHQETLMNLASTLSNIALAYFYKKDLDPAKEFFEKAKEYAEEAKDISDLSVITFNLSRIVYEKDHNYDRFLESLEVSAKYAKEVGKLDTLVEILIKECEIRLEIGEYYLSFELLSEIACHLKNIGNFNLHIFTELLRAKYFLRIGETNESIAYFKEAVNLVQEKESVNSAAFMLKEAVEMYVCVNDIWNSVEVLCNICNLDSNKLRDGVSEQSKHMEVEKIMLPNFIVDTLPADRWRQNIIVCEYRKEKKYLPALFSKLCVEYTKKADWFRLHDEARCYYNVAETESDQSIALYYLGCADMEKKNYSDAEKCFKEIVEFGNKANQVRWIWANIELAKIEIQRKNFGVSLQYYNAGKSELKQSSETSEIVNACMSYVQQLFNEGYLEEAIACADSLSKEIENTDLRKNIEEMIEIFKKIRKKRSEKGIPDVKTASPQEIAEEAIRLYDTGENSAYAWELIQIAKEKYEEAGDRDGVGRCENNIADFNNKEGKVEEAAVHYERAMRIKEETSDIRGVINQISNIIGLYVMNQDTIDVSKHIDYALLHMPEYEDYIEKYRLFYSLFLYYMLNSKYAEAHHFAKLTYKGIGYLPESDKLPKASKMLIDFINSIEGAFRVSEGAGSTSDHFMDRVQEAVRMYKKGNFSECCTLLDRLCEEAKSNHFQLGIVKGTYGNACLYIGRYQEALEKFNEAICLFSEAKEIEKSEANAHICTAINGKTQALDHMGQTEKAIDILRKEILRDGIPDSARFAYTISLCNRLITSNQDTIIENDPLFQEIIDRLSSYVDNKQLSHEEKGVLYCTFGALYRVISYNVEAVRYYKLAKKEFLITNSLHLKKVELILKSIEDEESE